jgi:sulfur carrier protein ThiS
MQITLKLFATLGDFLPAGSRYNQIEVEVPVGVTVASVIQQHQLPDKLVHLVLVNGVYINPLERASKVLQAGDVLAIWPPIAGG